MNAQKAGGRRWLLKAFVLAIVAVVVSGFVLVDARG